MVVIQYPSSRTDILSRVTAIKLWSTRLRVAVLSPGGGNSFDVSSNPCYLSDGRLDRIALVYTFCPEAAHPTVKPSRDSSLVKYSVLCTTTRVSNCYLYAREDQCDSTHPVKIFPFFARSNFVWLSIRHRYRSSGSSQRPRSNMVIVVKLPTLIRPYTIRLWGDSLYSTGEYGITLELWSLLEGAFFYSRYRFWCFCPWIPFGVCVHVVANDLST